MKPSGYYDVPSILEVEEMMVVVALVVEFVMELAAEVCS